MKPITVKRYHYTSALGEECFENVTLYVDDDSTCENHLESADGIDYALSENEFVEFERSIGRTFLSKNLRPVMCNGRLISADELKAIQYIFGVNRSELATLLGLHKASITNIFKGKAMSSTLALLVLERLSHELDNRGAIKHLLEQNAVKPKAATA